MHAFVNLPLVIPHTAAGVALLMVFGRRGIFGRLFAPIGITFTDTVAGIAVAMAFVGLPFLVNAGREAFAQVDSEYELAALADGASPWQAFWHVTLPQAWPGVLTGMLMMWARGVSEFGAVVILAYHPKVVPVLVYERFEGFGLAAAQPVAVLLILGALLVFVLVNTIGRRSGFAMTASCQALFAVSSSCAILTTITASCRLNPYPEYDRRSHAQRT